MAINPYTLNGLYQKGILDYVDPELCAGQPIVSQYNGMSNPYAQNYMNNAMQGNLYQNHGMQKDSFTFNGGGIGSKSNSFNNMFGQNGVGVYSSSVNNMFGDDKVGSRYQGNAFGTGDTSIGSYYQGGGENSFGGFSDARNSINGGVAKAQAIYNNTPSVIKGIAAVAIGLLGIKMLFKGKGSKTAKKSFLEKIQFWKNPKPEPKKAEKKSFLSKLKFWK